MSDGTKHPDQPHIPTPAEVRHEHPTVLVPAHPGDEVRRIESHDGEPEGVATASPVVVTAAAPSVDAPETVSAVSVAPAQPASVTLNVDSPSADGPTVEVGSVQRRAQEADELAQVIAATAETVPGVHALGSPTARAIDSARTRLLGRTSVPGVSVLVDDDVLRVSVALVAEYPAAVDEVADTVRTDVTTALQARHPGPVDIDITVTDIHGPFDPADPDPGEAIDAAKAAVSDATAAAGDALGDATAAAGDALDRAKAGASDAVDSARAGAADLADAAGDAVQRLSERQAKATDDEVTPTGSAVVDTEAEAGTAADAAVTDSSPVVSGSTDEVSEELAEAARQLASAADSLASVAEEVTRGADPSLAEDVTDPVAGADEVAPAAPALAGPDVPEDAPSDATAESASGEGQDTASSTTASKPAPADAASAETADSDLVVADVDDLSTDAADAGSPSAAAADATADHSKER